MKLLLTDIDLIKSIINSIFCFIFNKFVIYIIKYIPDYYLSLIFNSYIKIDDELLDYESDSDLSDSNLNLSKKDYNTLEEYNKYLKYWEYDTLLHLFNLKQYTYNIQNNYILPIVNTIPINEELINNKYNSYIIIINSFLFNIKINRNNIKEIVFQTKYEIIFKTYLLYILNNCINTNTINHIFNKQYKYLYIQYIKNNKINYILIDIENNYNILKHQPVLFNKINL